MKRQKHHPRYLPMLAAIALSLVMTCGVFAQAQVAEEAVEVAARKIFQQSGRQALRELSDMGGQTAVRELLEQSAREGGDSLVQKVAQYGIEDGPSALRAIGRSPAKMVGALDGLSPGLRPAAIHAVERDPQVLMPLIEKHGSAALEVACKQPGVGEKLMSTLGGDGISLGRKLTTDQAIVAARHADEIAALAPAERASVVGKILASPKPVLEFLETHPRVLRTAAGVGLVLAVKDQILGDRGETVVLPDGRVITRPAHPGLFERVLPQSLAFLSFPLTILCAVIAAGVGGWFTMHIWGTWKLHRLRHVVALANARTPRA